ncbi:MAG: type II secretion system protein GspG [Labilithrix sp.]|nr:type II secretion system protein GspG [Labilithrix sp.]MCW5811164.1 type II secretion system protein GspG [Labilithrix sp.]
MIGDLPPLQVRQREVRRGVGTKVGIAILIGFVGWMFAMGTVGARAESQAMKPRQAKYDCLALHPVAEKWVVDHAGECPTVARLRAEREISPGSKITDPWGHEYEIECGESDEVVVRSFGPDGRAGTHDDIVVGPLE